MVEYFIIKAGERLGKAVSEHPGGGYDSIKSAKRAALAELGTQENWFIVEFSRLSARPVLKCEDGAIVNV